MSTSGIREEAGVRSGERRALSPPFLASCTCREEVEVGSSSKSSFPFFPVGFLRMPTLPRHLADIGHAPSLRWLFVPDTDHTRRQLATESSRSCTRLFCSSVSSPQLSASRRRRGHKLSLTSKRKLLARRGRRGVRGTRLRRPVSRIRLPNLSAIFIFKA